MKTILFIDKNDTEVWDSFRRYDYVLDEYEAIGTYAVCAWHSEGMSVHAAIPDLAKLVGTEEQWRAVIACDLRSKGIDPIEDVHFDNPFDFPESYALTDKDPVRESKRGFVRLTQMLGGIPEKAAASWSEWLQGSYEAAEIEKVTKAVASDIIEPPKLGDVDIVFPQIEGKYDMLERYRLGVRRPQEIICITPRNVDADLSKERQADLAEMSRKAEEERVALLELAYKVENSRELGMSESEHEQLKSELNRRKVKLAQSEQALGFWQRNNYPACTRFIVCDRRAESLEVEEEPNAENSPAQAKNTRIWEEIVPEKELADVHEPDAWFHFWLCVLSLVTADISPDYLQPFAVHSISLNLDEAEFAKVLSQRYTQWVSIRELVESELAGEAQRRIPSELEMVELPKCQTSIGVIFDLVDEGNLFVDQSAMGFFRDEPEADAKIWAKQKANVLDEFHRLLRAPVRGVSLAVAQFKTSNSLKEDVLDQCVMNRYQCEELADNLREIELGLGRDVEPMAFEVETYRDSIEEDGRAILKATGKRASRRQAFWAIGVACLALVVGFLPYCLGLGNGFAANASAGLVTLASCVLLAIVAVITLAAMRADVNKAYRTFNNNIGGKLSSLHAETSRIGKRISSYATFKKSWSLLNRQKHRNDPSARALRLGKQEALLRTRMADIEKVSSSVEVDYDLYRDILRSGWDGASEMLEIPSVFNICDATRTERPLNEGLASCTTVEVPYSFISDVRLVQIGVS